MARNLAFLCDRGKASSQHQPKMSRCDSALTRTNALSLIQGGRFSVEQSAEVDAQLSVGFLSLFLAITACENDRSAHCLVRTAHRTFSSR